MNALDWIKTHKMVAGLFGAAVAGYVLYSFLHKSSSGGTASSITGGNAVQSGSPQYLVPVVQTDGLSPQSAQQTSANPMPASTSTTPTTNVPSPATPANLSPSIPGLGEINTAQGQMIILGKVVGTGPQAYQGYDVGGGAPVYYGNAQSLAIGPNLALPGNYVYTPVADATLVSATPTHNG